MFNSVGKQAYKLELLARWRIHNVFYVLPLEQDNIKNRQEFSLLEFEADNNKKYKVKVIQDSTIYAKEANKHLLKLYYLVVWKGYSEEKNT